VFDDFSSGWWQLAPYRNRLLGCATGQKQAKQQPSFPHAFFALSGLHVDGNLDG